MSGAPELEAAVPTPGAADRAPQVREMFDTLAPRYDLGNRVLSLGLDQPWRRKAMAALGDTAQGDVLDLCAGTLDLTQALLAFGPRSITAVDFAQKMLDAGRSKIPDDAPVTLVCADARTLPLEDDSVDAIICGFGLRNVPEVGKALDECARVLRPGGRLVVLEFFQPTTWLSRLLQSTYNRIIMPMVGGLVTGFREAYAYLAGSIEAFETRPDFEALVAARGFTVEGRDLFPPVASIVSGTRT